MSCESDRYTWATLFQAWSDVLVEFGVRWGVQISLLIGLGIGLGLGLSTWMIHRIVRYVCQ